MKSLQQATLLVEGGHTLRGLKFAFVTSTKKQVGQFFPSSDASHL